MAVLTETTRYNAEDGATVATFVARPEGAGPFPARYLKH
jgi:hypothetical protein